MSVTLGPGRSIKVSSKGNQTLRMINTKHMKWITTVKQSDREQNTLSIRVEREYDLVSSNNNNNNNNNYYSVSPYHQRCFMQII